jgi:hypothetical protein
MQIPSLPPDPELLKVLLEPLFEDFDYWLTRSETLLSTTELSFLLPELQAEVLSRVRHALKEIHAARSLFQATDGQVGVEVSLLMDWHKLVTECWRIAIQHRKSDRS